MRRLLIRLLIVAVLSAASAAVAAAETTRDPNHTGVDRFGEPIDWVNVSTQCQPCQSLADQYNAVMRQLFRLRYLRATIVDRTRQGFRSLAARHGVNNPGHAEEAFGLTAAFNEYNVDLDSRISSFEAQAAYLRDALLRCEGQCAQAPQPTGAVPAPGGEPGTPQAPQAPPPVPEALVLGFPWQGPYPVVCHRCALLAQRLNELPDLARLRLIQIQEIRNSEMIRRQHERLLRLSDPWSFGDPPPSDPNPGAEDEIARLTRELDAIKRNFEETLALYRECIKDCPQTAGEKCPLPPAKKAIVVGPNAEVGSGARTKEKVKEAVAGAVGGLLGGALGGIGGGGGGGSGGGSREPQTQDDPIGKDQKVVSAAGGVELATGAKLTDGGLLVSSKINSAPGSGTFQAVFLEDGRGRRIAPYLYAIYELWGEWQLTVSWTYDRWVNGQHVEHREGSWTESWSEKLGTLAFLIAGKAREAGIWNQLGFNNASHGVQALGSHFKITRKDLRDGPVNLIVHVTLPEADPVTTVPLIYEISLKPGSENEVLIKAAAQTLAEKRDCYKTAVKQ